MKGYLINSTKNNIIRIVVLYTCGKKIYVRETTFLLGQAVPAGLHIRMNLQTGQNEGKLMEGDDGVKYWKSGEKEGKCCHIVYKLRIGQITVNMQT